MLSLWSNFSGPIQGHTHSVDRASVWCSSDTFHTSTIGEKPPWTQKLWHSTHQPGGRNRSWPPKRILHTEVPKESVRVVFESPTSFWLVEQPMTGRPAEMELQKWPAFWQPFKLRSACCLLIGGRTVSLRLGYMKTVIVFRVTRFCAQQLSFHGVVYEMGSSLLFKNYNKHVGISILQDQHVKGWLEKTQETSQWAKCPEIVANQFDSTGHRWGGIWGYHSPLKSKQVVDASLDICAHHRLLSNQRPQHRVGHLPRMPFGCKMWLWVNIYRQ